MDLGSEKGLPVNEDLRCCYPDILADIEELKKEGWIREINQQVLNATTQTSQGAQGLGSESVIPTTI